MASAGEAPYDDNLWVMEAVGATLVVALLVGAASLLVYDTRRARKAESRQPYSLWRTASRALALAVPSVCVWTLFPVPTWLVVLVPLSVVLWSELDLVRAPCIRVPVRRWWASGATHTTRPRPRMVAPTHQLLVRRAHDNRPVAIVAAAPLGLSEAPPAFKLRSPDGSPEVAGDTMRLSHVRAACGCVVPCHASPRTTPHHATPHRATHLAYVANMGRVLWTRNTRRSSARPVTRAPCRPRRRLLAAAASTGWHTRRGPPLRIEHWAWSGGSYTRRWPWATTRRCQAVA